MVNYVNRSMELVLGQATVNVYAVGLFHSSTDQPSDLDDIDRSSVNLPEMHTDHCYC